MYTLYLGIGGSVDCECSISCGIIVRSLSGVRLFQCHKVTGLLLPSSTQLGLRRFRNSGSPSSQNTTSDLSDVPEHETVITGASSELSVTPFHGRTHRNLHEFSPGRRCLLFRHRTSVLSSRGVLQYSLISQVRIFGKFSCTTYHERLFTLNLWLCIQYDLFGDAVSLMDLGHTNACHPRTKSFWRLPFGGLQCAVRVFAMCKLS